MKMKGSVGLFAKKDGLSEVRIHFPKWLLPDGRELTDVTVFPHPCGTCVGGDHTHVEPFDTREVAHWVRRDCVELSPEHREIIDQYLVAKLRLWEITNAMHQKHISAHAPLLCLPTELPQEMGKI